jgi:hypothetical protein
MVADEAICALACTRGASAFLSINTCHLLPFVSGFRARGRHEAPFWPFVLSLYPLAVPCFSPL